MELDTYDDYDRYDNSVDDLTDEELFALSDSLGRVEHLSLSGGEPLMRRDIFDHVQLESTTGTITFDNSGNFKAATQSTVNIHRDGFPSVDPLTFDLNFSEISGLATDDNSLYYWEGAGGTGAWSAAARRQSPSVRSSTKAARSRAFANTPISMAPSPRSHSPSARCASRSRILRRRPHSMCSRTPARRSSWCPKARPSA